MSGLASSAVFRDIQALFEGGAAGGLSDRQLLDQFATGPRDSAEAAFEVLVRRHGPMVLRICRNVLGDATDADDAFQATFLVLVKERRSIRRLESLASWLYGVACRVAARAKVDAARRRSAERRAPLRVIAGADSDGANQNEIAEFGSIIQEEVRRLPEKYRTVVALCYWQGLTQEQAAMRLGCPLGTVRSRLARARGKLHTRLNRRGLAPLVAALGSQSSRGINLSPVPNALLISTVESGAQIVARISLAAAAHPSVVALTQRTLRSLFIMKIRTIAIPALVLGLGAVGVLLAASTAEPGVPPTTSRRPQPTAASQKTKIQPALVSLGDYVVEPPDLLLVEVLDALPGRPISGERLVRPDGKISLGFYGEVEVSGLSLPEVKERIIRHLSRYLTDVSLGICELDDEGKPVGRIAPRDSATVFIDVTAYNSKNYYIQGEVAVPGRLPVTGNETILDVINYAGGMTRYADHQRVVLYRRPKKGGPLQALPVDIDQITMGDDPTTNYQILPGDRVVVPRDPKAGATRTDEDAQPARQTPRSKNRPPEYFDRPTNELDPTAAQRTPAPLVRRGDQTSLLHHVEERLNQVESKLDRILDALDKRRP